MRKTALVTGMHTSLAYLVAEKLIKDGNMRVIAPVRVRESDRVDALIRNYGENVIVSDFSPLDFQEAKELVAAADYILNLDFVGMLESEHFPDFAEKVNYFYTKNFVDAVIETGSDAKIIELSTTGIYGGRTMKRPYAAVGHPAMPAYYDLASVSKLRGERYLVESGIKGFYVLRTAPVADETFVKRMLDGAMIFKNPLDAPAEFITAEELSEVIFRLVVSIDENEKKVKENAIYDIGCGEREIYRDFVANIAGKLKLNVDKIAEPRWFVKRCGFGAWIKDGRVLQDAFGIEKISVERYITENLVKNSNRIFGTLSPLIKKFIVSKLSIMTNSPYYWQENGMNDRVNVFYGGYDKIRELPLKISDVSITQTEGGDPPGFYESENSPYLTENDLKTYAAARGGKCFDVSTRGVDFKRKTLWECANGHTFKMTPYGVLCGGYWCGECMTPAPWKYFESVKKSDYHNFFYKEEFLPYEEYVISANDYHDVMREDSAEKNLKPDKIKKFKKG